jgi:hypothetical protein
MGSSGSKTRFLNSVICLMSFSNKKSNSKKISTKSLSFKNGYWKTVPSKFDKFKINTYSQSRSQFNLLLNSQNGAKPRSDLYNWKRISRNLQFLYIFSLSFILSSSILSSPKSSRPTSSQIRKKEIRQLIDILNLNIITAFSQLDIGRTIEISLSPSKSYSFLY